MTRLTPFEAVIDVVDAARCRAETTVVKSSICVGLSIAIYRAAIRKLDINIIYLVTELLSTITYLLPVDSKSTQYYILTLIVHLESRNLEGENIINLIMKGFLLSLASLSPYSVRYIYIELCRIFKNNQNDFPAFPNNVDSVFLQNNMLSHHLPALAKQQQSKWKDITHTTLFNMSDSAQANFNDAEESTPRSQNLGFVNKDFSLFSQGKILSYLATDLNVALEFEQKDSNRRNSLAIPEAVTLLERNLEIRSVSAFTQPVRLYRVNSPWSGLIGSDSALIVPNLLLYSVSKDGRIDLHIQYPTSTGDIKPEDPDQPIIHDGRVSHQEVCNYLRFVVPEASIEMEQSRILIKNVSLVAIESIAHHLACDLIAVAYYKVVGISLSPLPDLTSYNPHRYFSPDRLWDRAAGLYLLLGRFDLLGVESDSDNSKEALQEKILKLTSTTSSNPEDVLKEYFEARVDLIPEYIRLFENEPDLHPLMAALGDYYHREYLKSNDSRSVEVDFRYLSSPSGIEKMQRHVYNLDLEQLQKSLKAYYPSILRSPKYTPQRFLYDNIMVLLFSANQIMALPPSPSPESKYQKIIKVLQQLLEIDFLTKSITRSCDPSVSTNKLESLIKDARIMREKLYTELMSDLLPGIEVPEFSVSATTSIGLLQLLIKVKSEQT